MSRKESKFGEKHLKPFDTKNDVFNKVMREFNESINDFKEKYKTGNGKKNMSNDHRDYDDIEETDPMNNMSFLIRAFFEDKKDQRVFIEQMLGKIFVMIEEFKKSEGKLKKNKDKMRELQESIYRMSSQLDSVEAELRDLKSRKARNHIFDMNSFDKDSFEKDSFEKNSKKVSSGFRVNLGDSLRRKKYDFGDDED